MTSISSPDTRDYTVRIRDKELFQWLKVQAAIRSMPLYQLVEQIVREAIRSDPDFVEPKSDDTDTI